MQISQFEVEDPTLFEELSLKKKWSNVMKDPTRAIKDTSINGNAYWQLLNHLPAAGVDKIVTDHVLRQDKGSCERILQKILDEKKGEDLKKESQ
jgi:hypothetical protein